ncbi:hypothetical protein FIBSPDRAFT_969225 [Athelia psychrophila]|uniref:Uncharacterized protein n=1 Tax=Athelia psychrophila TaxID=1759441 RepID=A0A167TR85_9AGAM|nr:hypothetical protein FIBSPDRAFT_969225 [Fibularhizoctonia sp. CBS 109695]
MPLFDLVNANLQSAVTTSASRSTGSSRHHRTSSGLDGLDVLADAARQSTPRTETGSSSPQRQASTPAPLRAPLFTPEDPQTNLRRPREDEDQDQDDAQRYSQKRRVMEDFTRDLCSEDFKENICLRLLMLLLDPGVWSYKVGLLERILRHIRINPSDYLIPSDLVSFITTHPFSTAVSKALVAIRAELKRQLADLWKKKKDIFVVVSALGKKTRMEPTDAIWGRWAWVQMKLIDFCELVENKQQDDDKFWDWLDSELAALREQYEAEEPVTRAQSINLFFSATLLIHRRLRPAVKTVRSGTRRTIPAWQVAISEVVEDMESYEIQDPDGDASQLPNGQEGMHSEDQETPSEG